MLVEFYVLFLSFELLKKRQKKNQRAKNDKEKKIQRREKK